MKLLWLDLETTGLKPETDIVLEVALVVTNERLVPEAEYQAVVKRSLSHPAIVGMDDYVRDMHTRNGLLAELEGGRDAAQVAADLDAIAKRFRLYRFQSRNPAMLAGASVHFDRGFLKDFAPDFESKLYHRHMDVSGLRAATRLWYPRKVTFHGNDNHRAMGDVRDSIEQARTVKRLLEGVA